MKIEIAKGIVIQTILNSGAKVANNCITKQGNDCVVGIGITV